MLLYLLTAVCFVGIVDMADTHCNRITFIKDETLNGKSVVETSNTTNDVEKALECSASCESNPDCVYFRLVKRQCSTFTSFVTPATSSSLPGAIYYTKDGSNPCRRDLGYTYLQSPRLCVKLLYESSDFGNRTVGETACETEGGRLAVLDSVEKQSHAMAYLRSLGENPAFPVKVWVGIMPRFPYFFNFKWSTGATVSTTALWAEGEPAYLPHQPCVVMSSKGLHETPCGNRYRCLCEITLNTQ